jgi:dihydrofolate reductase
MSDSPGPAVEVVRENGLDRVRALKAQDGLDLWLVGGGTLAHSLLPEIDRLVLKVNPWVIGAGIPLFAGAFSPTAFRAVGEKELAGGVRVVTYDRA